MKLSKTLNYEVWEFLEGVEALSVDFLFMCYLVYESEHEVNKCLKEFNFDKVLHDLRNFIDKLSLHLDLVGEFIYISSNHEEAIFWDSISRTHDVLYKVKLGEIEHVAQYLGDELSKYGISVAEDRLKLALQYVYNKLSQYDDITKIPKDVLEIVLPGKWMLFFSVHKYAAKVFKLIMYKIAEKKIYSAKAEYWTLPKDKKYRIIITYVSNFMDVQQVVKTLHELVEALDTTPVSKMQIKFKPDIFTHKGMYAKGQAGKNYENIRRHPHTRLRSPEIHI